MSRSQAGYATLNASDDGVITAVNAEAGQVVTAGQSVFKLAREPGVEVAISVPENRIGELAGGEAAGRSRSGPIQRNCTPPSARSRRRGQ